MPDWLDWQSLRLLVPILFTFWVMAESIGIMVAVFRIFGITNPALQRNHEIKGVFLASDLLPIGRLLALPWVKTFHYFRRKRSERIHHLLSQLQVSPEPLPAHLVHKIEAHHTADRKVHTCLVQITQTTGADNTQWRGQLSKYLSDLEVETT